MGLTIVKRNPVSAKKTVRKSASLAAKPSAANCSKLYYIIQLISTDKHGKPSASVYQNGKFTTGSADSFSNKGAAGTKMKQIEKKVKDAMDAGEFNEKPLKPYSLLLTAIVVRK